MKPIISISDIIDSYIQGVTDQALEGYSSVSISAVIKAFREIKVHVMEHERKQST